MNIGFSNVLSCLTLILGAAILPAAVQPAEQLRRDDSVKLAREALKADAKDGRKTNAHPSREERRREEFKKLSPEEREAKRKEIKERLEKRIAELRAKQTAGALTVQETRELERREQILKRFEQTPAPATPPAVPSSK